MDVVTICEAAWVMGLICGSISIVGVKD